MPEDPHQSGPHGGHRSGARTGRLPARLVEARLLSPTVRELTLEVEMPTDAPFSYEAGQYVDLYVPTNALTMKRPYSLASAPNARGKNRFDIAVTRAENGNTSDALHGHAVGGTYEVDGPRGGFVRRDRMATLFVGAGTGLAPLRAMIQDDLRAGAGAPLALLFGGRDESHLLWKTDVDEWKKTDRLNVDVTLSRAAESWSGLRGYVQDHVIAAYDRIAANSDTQVFVCGLSEMVIGVVTALEKHGVSGARLFSESYQ
ncbi:MAG: FAD-dependent oxidoreductase [Polyangiaceae bacterium]